MFKTVMAALNANGIKARAEENTTELLAGQTWQSRHSFLSRRTKNRLTRPIALVGQGCKNRLLQAVDQFLFGSRLTMTTRKFGDGSYKPSVFVLFDLQFEGTIEN